ncbi:MAG: hypothetical protein GEU93_07450 [Propionibacteriales bacterium]|nr:hypothetical protein [Propionibacteriales bacterium]
MGDDCESAGDAVWRESRNAAQVVRYGGFELRPMADGGPAVSSTHSQGIAPGGCYPPSDWAPPLPRPSEAEEQLAEALERFADARERLGDTLETSLRDQAEELRQGAEDLENWDRPPICWPPYPPPTSPEFPPAYWRDQFPRTLTTAPDVAQAREATDADA